MPGQSEGALGRGLKEKPSFILPSSPGWSYRRGMDTLRINQMQISSELPVEKERIWSLGQRMSTA